MGNTDCDYPNTIFVVLILWNPIITLRPKIPRAFALGIFLSDAPAGHADDIVVHGVGAVIGADAAGAGEYIIARVGGLFIPQNEDGVLARLNERLAAGISGAEGGIAAGYSLHAGEKPISGAGEPGGLHIWLTGVGPGRIGSLVPVRGHGHRSAAAQLGVAQVRAAGIAPADGDAGALAGGKCLAAYSQNDALHLAGDIVFRVLDGLRTGIARFEVICRLTAGADLVDLLPGGVSEGDGLRPLGIAGGVGINLFIRGLPAIELVPLLGSQVSPVPAGSDPLLVKEGAAVIVGDGVVVPPIGGVAVRTVGKVRRRGPDCHRMAA